MRCFTSYFGLLTLACLATMISGASAQITSPNQIDALIKEAGELQKTNTAEASRKALGKLEEALSAARTQADTSRELEIYEPLAQVLNQLSEYRKAADYLKQGLTSARNLKNPAKEAICLQALGNVTANLGDLPAAITYLEQALVIFRQLNDRDNSAATLSALGGLQNRTGKRAQATESAEQALALYRELKNRKGERDVLTVLGEFFQVQGNSRKAVEIWEQCLDLLKEFPDETKRVELLYNLGSAYVNLGESAKAIDARTQSLDLSRKLGFKQGEAFNLMGLGFIYNRQGEYQRALDVYTQSLPIFRAISDKRGEGLALGKLAETLNLLGERQQSLTYQLEGLKILRAIKDRGPEGIAFYTLGTIYLGLDDLTRAQECLEEALRIAIEVKNRAEEASTLRYLAIVYRKQNNLPKALVTFQQALEISQAINNRFSEIASLVGAGSIAFYQGNLSQAETYLTQGLALARATQQLQGEATALFRLAQISHARGQLAEARQHILAAQTLIETRREAVANPNLRATLLADLQEQYEFQIDLWLDSQSADKTAPFTTEALQISEQSRARSLLDLLTVMRTDLRQGVNPDLLAQEATLRQQINAKAAQRNAALNRKDAAAEVTSLTNELNQLFAQVEIVEATIRRQSPQYGSLTQARALTAAEIQKEVLDTESVLLEYALGNNQSHLWLVTPTSVTSFVLPKRSEIETVARQLYAALSAAPSKERRTVTNDYARQAATLSQLLLKPVAAHLGNKRLLIVAPEALQFLPFGTLPDPNAPSQPLLVNHEIISLPSASVMAALRRELTRPRTTDKTVAVFADPVFVSEDARVKNPLAIKQELSQPEQLASNPTNAAWRNAVRSVTNDDRASLQRLPFSRDEAEAIAAVTPAGGVLKALDFQASRTAALSDKLADFRIVHFATHGLLDSAHPELSGLALSLVDETGKAQDGYLRLNEIYNMKLNADLVVLSACQTGLGKEVKGEGLIGLTRGFMYAGAPRVVASLWQVNDAATAELMKRFYRGMLKEKLRPAAALRQAQLELMKKPAWKAPYYWGAFTLQGEWK